MWTGFRKCRRCRLRKERSQVLGWGDSLVSKSVTIQAGMRISLNTRTHIKKKKKGGHADI